MATSTFSSGHHLVNRYRIDELLGVGHTAEVYVAQDLSLQRTVVVKVLLPRLAEHEDVRRNFRDRIIRAATLSHPHLARVYDGGQEAGAIFMITEYLTGGSLEDVLASGRRLSVDDGARLGRDVAGVLGYVHDNGFVHGSLSPSKLLFDSEGQVRLSDITLAGLGTAYRERFRLDDVRYLSPEQAIGDPAGPKSDVYALALIIFESVTGVTAFEGVTPEAVLRARINASLPVRPELGTLDMLLAQAAVPDPLLRLDAEPFASRLSGVMSNATPLVVAPVRAEVPLLGQFTPLEPRRSIGFRPPSPEQITGATAAVPSRIPRPVRVRADADWAPEVAAPSPRRATPRGLEHLDYERPPRNRRLAFFLAALLLLVVAVGGGAAWKLGLFSESHNVPSLTSLTLSEAATQLSADGFTVTANRHASSSTVKKNAIISQSPAAGTSASSGQVITVTISDGPVMVTLPATLLGEDCGTATAQLAKLRVSAQCPSSAAVTSSTVPAGRVAKILYRGRTAPRAVPLHSTLVLALSRGAATTTTTTTVAPGTTTSTVAGPTTTLTTTTTVAPTLVTVPNVVGQDQAQVHAAMKAAGLYFRTSGPGSGAQPTWTTVVSQVPAGGTKVKRLSTVSLNVK